MRRHRIRVDRPRIGMKNLVTHGVLVNHELAPDAGRGPCLGGLRLGVELLAGDIGVGHDKPAPAVNRVPAMIMLTVMTVPKNNTMTPSMCQPVNVKPEAR